MVTVVYQGSVAFVFSKICVIFGITTVNSTPMIPVPITIIAIG